MGRTGGLCCLLVVCAASDETCPESVPIIDISAWTSANESSPARARVVAEFDDAMTRVGLCALRGHGVPSEVFALFQSG